MKYSLVLVPDKIFSKKLIKLSLDLKKIKSVYVVGENSIPHCTVLQFYSRKKPENICKDMPKNINLYLNVKRHYTNFSSKKKTWFGLEVKKTKELMQLQKDLLLRMPYIKPYNKIDREYFPHFTTGMVPRAIPKYVLRDKNILKNKIICRLHLCKSGRHWKAEKLLL